MYVNRFVVGPKFAAQLLTSAADIAEYPCTEQIQVEELQFLLTTTVSSSVTVIVNFYARPVQGSITGQALIGTLNIPTGAAAGKTYYKKISPVTIPQGQLLAVTVGTAATSAGAGVSQAKVSVDPEVEGNLVNMVASA